MELNSCKLNQPVLSLHFLNSADNIKLNKFRVTLKYNSLPSWPNAT